MFREYMILPSISIITLTYNPDLDTFSKVLESIRMQKYPRKRIEHLVMDGGSINGSMEMAKKYGCIIHRMPTLQRNGEARKGLGIARAKNEIIAFIEADNILVGEDWMQQMVEPFRENNEIVGTFSMHNSYEKDMSLLTRYCAFIGVNDPTVYYLGKSEKLPLFQSRYDKGITLRDTSDYTVVRFTPKTLPTLGDNGHMVRRRVIAKVNKHPKDFLHTDAFALLVSKKFDTYAVVKNSIIHVIGSSIVDLYIRRIMYKKLHYDFNKSKRLYHVFNPQSRVDQRNLALFILYSLTFVQPLVISIRGFIAVSDIAWFLHPIVCFMAVLSYGYSELRLFIANSSRES